MDTSVEPHVPDPETLASARRHFEGYLRRQDLKLTTQRMEILERVSKITEHFTADDLVELFRRKKSKPSKATIYRTLSLLTECNILEEHSFKLFPASIYEFSWGREHHDHLICLSCGKIIEFLSEQIEDLQEQVAAEHGFHPRFHSQKIYGICSECWEKGVRVLS